MPPGNESLYPSIRATPIIGRLQILKQIAQAIQDPCETPIIFYITAAGGRGKTFLLTEILARLQDHNNPGEWHSHDVLAARRLVDFYHLKTHSPEGLIQEIVEALDPGGGEFDKYQAERKKLYQIKYDLAESLRELMQQRDVMLQAFLEDINRLHPAYRKVVLALDTAENLVYETDRVQEALGLRDQRLGVADWLVNQFLPNIRNAVILIAGRPDPAQFVEHLRGLGNPIRLVVYKLPDFSEDESLEYFNAVELQTSQTDPETAKMLAGVPLDTRRTIHYFASGQPLLLALVIDYLAVTSTLIPLVRVSPEQAREMTDTEDKQKDVQGQLKRAIGLGFKEARHPFDLVIEELAWAPKGIGAELLAWILNRQEPDESDIKKAQRYINSLRKAKPQISFIKIRPEDDLVFLQDEMYALFEEMHKELGIDKRNKIFSLILMFYEGKIDKIRKSIDIYLEQHLTKVLESLDRKLSPREITEIAKENEKFRLARASLQNYQVEQVYYMLAQNPVRGFELYYEYVEEAFSNNEPDLWLPLRDELLSFAKRSQLAGITEPGGLPLSIIESDTGARWIKQNISHGNYGLALEQIWSFRRSNPDLIPSRSFTDLDLKIWEGCALLNQGKELQKAEELLQEVLDGVNKLLVKPNAFEERRTRHLQAYAYSTLGYLYRCQGRLLVAIKQYEKALPLWRDLKDVSEQANTLNNLSYAEAEYGLFIEAKTHCQDALELRKKLGRRYTIALSINTLGVIETKNDEPNRARYRCEQALNIFRELEQPRGVGLACHALAESLRRMAGIPDLLTKEDALKQLDIAEMLAEEAVGIFTYQIHEPARQAEANIELGCVYREKARRLIPTKGKNKNAIAEEREAAAQKGEQALRKAYQIAKDEFTYRAIDALVNLAWLHYYMDEPEDARHTLLGEVLPLIDSKYLIQKAGWSKKIKDPEPWFWVQIGKSDLLLGLIEFDEYRSAHEEEDDINAEIHLRKAAHDWALSLAYDARFSPSFRDLKAAKDVIYQSVKGLNPQEMGWTRESIKQTYEEYHVPEHLQLFEKFMNDRFGRL